MHRRRPYQAHKRYSTKRHRTSLNHKHTETHQCHLRSRVLAVHYSRLPFHCSMQCRAPGLRVRVRGHHGPDVHAVHGLAIQNQIENTKAQKDRHLEGTLMTMMIWDQMWIPNPAIKGNGKWIGIVQKLTLFDRATQCPHATCFGHTQNLRERRISGHLISIAPASVDQCAGRW